MSCKIHRNTPRSPYNVGNGTPLQCSCLENPRDRGAWCTGCREVGARRCWWRGGESWLGDVGMVCCLSGRKQTKANTHTHTHTHANPGDFSHSFLLIEVPFPAHQTRNKWLLETSLSASSAHAWCQAKLEFLHGETRGKNWETHCNFSITLESISFSILCKLPRPTARRALSEGREVPQAAFPSCCLAMQTQR